MALTHLRKYEYSNFDYSSNNSYLFDEDNEFEYELDVLHNIFGNYYSDLIVLIKSKYEIVQFFKKTNMCEEDREKFLLKKICHVYTGQTYFGLIYNYTGLAVQLFPETNIHAKCSLIREINRLTKYISCTQQLVYIKNKNKIIKFQLEWYFHSKNIN